MGSIMRLLLLASVLGSVYLAPLDDAMSSQNGGHSADLTNSVPHPEVRLMTDVPHTTTPLTSFDTTTVDGSSTEALATTTESVPTSTLEGTVPHSQSTSHPAAPVVAASNPVTPKSVLTTDTPITGTTVMETSPLIMIEGKRDVTDTDTTTTTASSTAATSTTTTITVSDSTSAETTVISTAATTNAGSSSTTVDTTTVASTTATPVKMVATDATSPASTVNSADINISTGTVVAADTVTSASTITTANAIVAASTNASTTDEGTSTASTVAKSGTEGLMVSAERQGKSLGEEDKSTASTANTTASVPSIGTSTSLSAAAEHFTKEEVNPRKPWDNLVAQRQEEATSPTGAEPSESQSTETTLPTTVASTTVPSTSAETTVASTSVTAAAETRAGKAITNRISPPECAIILNSTLVQRRELFVPEELLSDSERLPTAFAEGRVPQWAREQCVTILTMLQPLNETCEAEKVDRVSKFGSVALTAVWDYLCIQNASNLIAMANQASTCYQGMPVLSQECGLLNKLGFDFHYPSELVLTPRVLNEGECRDVNSTNACLKERIRGLQSKCTAVQMDHMLAVLDLLFKSVKCDQVPPTPASPKSAGTHPFYSLWSIVLAVILAGFY